MVHAGWKPLLVRRAGIPQQALLGLSPTDMTEVREIDVPWRLIMRVPTRKNNILRYQYTMTGLYLLNADATSADLYRRHAGASLRMLGVLGSWLPWIDTAAAACKSEKNPIDTP